MAYKPLTMMRTRGLQGPLLARNANLKNHLVKPSGYYFGAGFNFVTYQGEKVVHNGEVLTHG